MAAHGRRGSGVPDLSELRSGIRAALRPTDNGDAVVAVCAACGQALPGDAAAITVMASDQVRQTVYAGDGVIEEFERAQYNLGAGPSLTAFSTGRPMLVPDLHAASAAARWPALVDAVSDLPIGGLFCFPMRLGAIGVGVCALYRRSTGSMSAADVAFVLSALDLTTVALLDVRSGGAGESLLGRLLVADSSSRRSVHQATGMLVVQLGVSPESAFARLRAHAYADGSDVEGIASDIVSRRLRLESDRG